MDLLVFDLDGTLLNRDAVISDFTGETLRLLAQNGVAYTVATGRTLHGARSVLEGHCFALPQAYKNGVMIWHPDQGYFSSNSMLAANELAHVVQACLDNGVTPFVYTLDADQQSTVYHPPIQSDVERKLIRTLGIQDHVRVQAYEELPADATITHINAIGDDEPIKAVFRAVESEPHLVAYSGVAWEGQQWRWLDVHHSNASKGGAVESLKNLLGFKSVICFGDSYNDLSMFETADESYAPENANDEIKAAATAIIGHHDEEGIARFLRERFDLKPRK